IKAAKRFDQLAVVCPGFVAIVSPWESEVPRTLVTRIIELTKDFEGDDQTLPALSEALDAVSQRLNADDAHSLVVRAIKATSVPTDEANQQLLLKVVTSLAPLVKPKDMPALADTLVEAVKGTRDPTVLEALSAEFSTFAASVKPEQARVLAFSVLEEMQK